MYGFLNTIRAEQPPPEALLLYKQQYIERRPLVLCPIKASAGGCSYRGRKNGHGLSHQDHPRLGGNTAF